MEYTHRERTTYAAWSYEQSDWMCDQSSRRLHRIGFGRPYTQGVGCSHGEGVVLAGWTYDGGDWVWISPAGDTIVSASYDTMLKVWDADTREQWHTVRRHANWVNGCAISPAGDTIVSASDDDTLKMWDVRTGEERLSLCGHTDTVRGCAISPSGDFIVSASYDKT